MEKNTKHFQPYLARSQILSIVKLQFYNLRLYPIIQGSFVDFDEMEFDFSEEKFLKLKKQNSNIYFT